MDEESQKELAEYLDNAIRNWRSKLDNVNKPQNQCI